MFFVLFVVQLPNLGLGMLDSSANMRRPQAILGAHKNGHTYLAPCLESHAPLDLVIIMLGTNDLESRFGLGAHDIAAGAGELVKLVSGDVRGQNGLKPQVLLSVPARSGR